MFRSHGSVLLRKEGHSYFVEVLLLLTFANASDEGLTFEVNVH